MPGKPPGVKENRVNSSDTCTRSLLKRKPTLPSCRFDFNGFDVKRQQKRFQFVKFIILKVFLFSVIYFQPVRRREFPTVFTRSQLDINSPTDVLDLLWNTYQFHYWTGHSKHQRVNKHQPIESSYLFGHHPMQLHT